MNEKKERKDFYNEKISAIEAANFLRLPERTFYKYVEDGVIPKIRDGEYLLGDVVNSYWRNQMGKKGLMIAKTRLTNAEAELRELELAEQRGDVIRKSAVSMAWGENVINCKAKLLSIPTKIAPELVGQDLIIIQQKLKAAIYEALKELADYDAKQFMVTTS
ncbi:MAG: hypothetical protein IJQ99_11630 [Synergistaceae bacterium]|nr:hypothetical protein [Synergistaceae bacterium]